MAQIKSYVELAGYDEMTAFASVDAERVVRSFVVTEKGGTLAAQILNDLMAPRGTTPVVQLLTGKRGSGKSHLLAFLRSILSQRTLRPALSHPQLTDALNRATEKTPISVAVSFSADQTTPFASVLRQAINGVLAEGAEFDDARWQQAVQQEQLFEQTLSMLPLDAQLIIFLDHLSPRWKAFPDLIADDLNWLKLIARQAEMLPVRAIVTLDQHDSLSRLESYGFPGEQARSFVFQELPDTLIAEAITQGILLRKPGAAEKLAGLYKYVKSSLPNFQWSKDEFLTWYPVHPVMATLAPFMYAHARSFSLPGFAATATARALNRPELSLITVDEAFDRYEYEMRKDETIADLFAFYDRVNTEAITALSGEDRLWARMLAKALVLLLLSEEKVGVRMLADVALLFEGHDKAESGYERAARILTHFEAHIPPNITLEQEGTDRTWQFQAALPALPLREQLVTAAQEVSPQDPRLATLLITIGSRALEDWNCDELIAATDNPAEAFSALPPESAFREILWRGTVRRGRVCLSTGEVENIPSSSLELSGDDLLGVESDTDYQEPLAGSSEEWRLMIVPCQSELSPETPVTSLRGLRWHPGPVADETVWQPLQQLAALRQRQHTKEEAEEAARIANDLYEQIQSLFIELYLARGSFVDLTGPRPLNYRTNVSISELLNQEICAALDHAYPDHPQFTEQFTSEHVSVLLTGLFATSSSNNAAIREQAARFAVPLGLVSESRGKYRLNVFNEAANLPPFIHALVTLVEIHADAEGRADVPLPKIIRLLSGSPYGLPLVAQHLILVAFISSGVYELVDEATGKRLTKANLHLGFEPERFTTLRRVATTDYPLEILHTWSKCLTGRADLPALISPDARQTVRDVLAEWLDRWREQNLRERFEEVPTELMTMTTWHTVSISIRRQERTALIVENIVEETLSLETGLSRILDLFGLDIAALEQTRAKMQSLGDFLDWMPTIIIIRNYLLAAETTGEEKIDREGEQLHAWLRETHELLMAEARLQIEQSFESYCEMYSDFYAAAHDASVGPGAWQEMTGNFYSSPEWQNFKLLTQVKLDGRAFESDARMLTELVEKTRCDLPIREILQRQPCCGCSFRLNRRLSLSSVLDAFRSLVKAAATYYSEELWKRRDELRAALQSCNDEALSAAVSDFLSACGEGRTELLTAEIVTFLNEHLPDVPLVAVLPELPRFDDTSFTREQLRENFNRWIDSLPEADGLRFRVERA